MNRILLLLFGCTAAYGQLLSYGIKGGLPLTDFIDTVSGPQGNVSSITNRYIVGPEVELHLPFGIGFEADALYRHFSYRSVSNLVDAVSTLTTTSGNWEFPILLRKGFSYGPFHPFAVAGVSFDKIAGISQTVETLALPSHLTSSASGSAAQLKNGFTAGATIGGGIDLKLLVVRISPEIRFTRWGSQQFNGIFPPGSASGSGGSLTSSQNQVEFLVGITF
jgi:hypothetical protein